MNTTVTLTKEHYTFRYPQDGELIGGLLYVCKTKISEGSVTSTVRMLSRWWVVQVFQVLYYRIKY
jgi:hypothetical protein